MYRIASQTALATILGAALAAPAMAQQPGENCPENPLQTDADRDDVVTAEEARVAAENEFARFDVNKDEKITRDEFIGCFAVPAMDMKKQASAEGETARTKETFARADLDQDGKVDRAEFGLGAQQAFDQALDLAETGTAAGKETEQAAAGQEEVVTEQDVPGANMAEEPQTDEAEAAEGVEVPEEGGLATVQEPEADPQDVGEPGRRAPEVVEEHFLGSPYADFPTMQDQKLTAEEIAFNSAELFAALDANRDRTLDRSEWMRMGPLAERGPAELGRVFEKIDADKDAAVSLSEYVTSVLAAHAAAAEAAARQEKTAAAEGTASEQAGQARTGDPTAAEEEPAAAETAEMAPGAEKEAGAPVFLYRIYRF